MHPALLHLMVLRAKARARSILRGLREPRRAVFTLLGAGLMATWILPVLFGAAMFREPLPEMVHVVLPTIALFACLLNVLVMKGEYTLLFSPPEINFLFPAPFTRRHLLLYKLATPVGGLLLMSAFIVVPTWRLVSSGFALFLAVFLALLFVHLFSTAYSLFTNTLVTQARTPLRKALLVALIVALGVGAFQLVDIPMDGNAIERLQHILQSPAYKIATAPFQPFGYLAAAERLFPDTLLWAAAALALNLVLLLFVVRLDRDFRESSLETSRKVYSRLERMRRTGRHFRVHERTSRFVLPLPPRFAGAGPTVWRQMTHALRMGATSGPVLIIAIVLLLSAAGYAVYMRETLQGKNVWFTAGMLAIYGTIFFPNVFRFDFRGDLDQMDILKSLPVNPSALAAGQIAVPVLCATFLHFCIFSVAALIQWKALYFIIGVTFAAPLNFLLLGIENILFLLFPTRLVRATPGDMQFVGRQMVMMFVKALIIGFVLAIASSFGGLLYLARESISSGITGAWLIVSAFAMATIPLAGWAFKQFDPSIHTPD